MSDTYVKVPLLGRAAFRVELDPVVFTGKTLDVYVLLNPDDALASALAHLNSEDDIDTFAAISTTQFEVLIPSAVADDMTAQNLYTVVVRVLDPDSEQSIYDLQAWLIPTRAGSTQEFTLMSSPVLSRRYLNTLSITAYAGASGSLEAIDTLAVSEGTEVQFQLVPDTQPELWVLTLGTNTTAAGVTQNPHDYNASTNAKYWKRKA